MAKASPLIARFEAACREEGKTIREFILSCKSSEVTAFAARHGISADELRDVYHELIAKESAAVMRAGGDLSSNSPSG